MKTPIVVWEQGDIYCFESVEKAECYLEAIDVRNNEYRCFDSNGVELTLSIVTKKGFASLEFVEISERENAVHRPEFLRTQIGDFLDRCGIIDASAVQQETLNELIDLLPRTQ